jgi:hypothetical protein
VSTWAWSFEIAGKIFAFDLPHPALELQCRMQRVIDFFDEAIS